jgi:NAD+ synthase
MSIQICEDIWHPNVTSRDDGHHGGIIVINGSPWEKDKLAVRYKVVDDCVRSLNYKVPVFYANLVGGQDELVFDGASFVECNGRKIQMKPWVEDFQIFTLISNNRTYEVETSITGEESLANYNNSMNTTAASYTAQVLGLRDYVGKVGYEKVILGVSGGVDSALVAAIAVDALGAENVTGIRMPSKFSSQHSLDDAAELCSALGIKMLTVPIEQAHAAYTAMLPEVLVGLADENIQARIRGNILMAYSNATGAMVLSTGNRSENFMGYATLYGDMAGGFNPIKDTYKTEVWTQCNWRNRYKPLIGFGPEGVVIPKQIITKPPSAELAEGQFDINSLPEYSVLDLIIKGLIEENKGINKVAEELDIDIELVRSIQQKITKSEYKRRQACPGVKINSLSIGRDRRYPIVNYFVP